MVQREIVFFQNTLKIKMVLKNGRLQKTAINFWEKKNTPVAGVYKLMTALLRGKVGSISNHYKQSKGRLNRGVWGNNEFLEVPIIETMVY